MLSTSARTLQWFDHGWRSLTVHPGVVSNDEIYKYKGESNSIIQLHKIKHWVLGCKLGRSCSKRNKVVLPSQDVHNITLKNLLLKHNATIQSLRIEIGDRDIVGREAIFTNIFQRQNCLNRVKILKISTDFIKYPLVPHSTSFQSIEFLEIYIKKKDDENANLKFTDWNKLIHNTKSLKSLIFTQGKRSISGSWRPVPFDNGKILKLPSDIEWIAITKFGFTLDMTDCDKLIGVRLMGVDPKRIIIFHWLHWAM